MRLHHVKSQTLASLLAEENLTVKFKKSVKTAYFDLKKRLLILPTWKVDDQHLVDMLIVHEVGHALHSNGLQEILDTCQADLLPYINILEDCRVDRLQRLRYPGTKKDYFHGSKSTIELKIFNVETYNYDELLLIDKINLKSKIGQHVGIPFTDEELVFLKAAFETETVEDVVELAYRIYEYERDRREEKSKQQQNENKSQDSMQIKGQGGDDSDDLEDDFFDGSTQQGALSDMDKDGEESEKERREVDKSSKPSSNAKMPSQDALTPQTAEQFDDWMKEHVQNDDDWYYNEEDVRYITVGDVPSQNVLLDGQKFRSLVKTYYTNFPREGSAAVEEGTKLDSDFKQAVAVLRKQFSVFRQAKKNTAVRTCKGSIDPNRLHLYKINDSIFYKKLETVQNAQNHRIIFLVDGSGSMINGGGMTTVMNQIIILRKFCQQEGIKFQCILFTSYSFGFYHSKYVKEEMDLTSTMYGPSRTKETFEESMKEQGSERAVLLDIVNDTDSDEYFYRVYQILTKGRLGDFGLGYNNTPINEAMGLMYSYLKAIKETMPEDKLNLIVLSDGAATDGRNKRTTIIKDAVSRREFTYEDLFGREAFRSGAYRRNYYYYMDRCFHSQFVVCQLLKEHGICHSISYYNCVYGFATMQQTDVVDSYWKEIGFTQNPIHLKGRAVGSEKPMTALTNKGIYIVSNAVPNIDYVCFFKHPENYAYRQKEQYHRLNKNGTAKESVLIAKEFRSEQAVLQIYKSIVLGVAKHLG